jgi:hypothetical protein
LIGTPSSQLNKQINYLSSCLASFSERKSGSGKVEHKCKPRTKPFWLVQTAARQRWTGSPVLDKTRKALSMHFPAIGGTILFSSSFAIFFVIVDSGNVRNGSSQLLRWRAIQYCVHYGWHCLASQAKF